MNVVSRYETDPPIQDLVPETGQSESEIAALIGIVRRQLPFILGMILLGLAGAGLYLFMATRWYTASADVLMEMRRSVVMSQDPTAPDLPSTALWWKARSRQSHRNASRRRWSRPSISATIPNSSSRITGPSTPLSTR